MKNLVTKLQKCCYNIDFAQSLKIAKMANFSLNMYLNQVDEVWNYLDPLGLKEISKNKFYKFMNENKIMQNADQAKSEDLLK